MCLQRNLWRLACGFVLLASFSRAADQSDKVERGKYLVEQVAQCGNCHTPWLPEGKPDLSKWLKGAVLNFQPIQPIEKWHKSSPDLTRTSYLWKRWGEKSVIRFLETGLGPKDNTADPPMPLYKLKPEDAEAIVEYLKSVE